MGWKSQAETDRDKLLVYAGKIENARAALVEAQKNAPPVSVSVTDPLAAALVDIDNALDSLDVRIGAASRKVIREAAQNEDRVVERAA